MVEVALHGLASGGLSDARKSAYAQRLSRGGDLYVIAGRYEVGGERPAWVLYSNCSGNPIMGMPGSKMERIYRAIINEAERGLFVFDG